VVKKKVGSPKWLFDDALHKPITRRDFLKFSLIGAVGLAGSWSAYRLLSGESIIPFSEEKPTGLWKWSREAYYYTKRSGKAYCQLCPNGCILGETDRSVCRNKTNVGGKLYTLAYGDPCAVHIDPIEKKPLFHYLPESQAYSIATAGCNFRCLNCQNWDISQEKPEDISHEDMMPDQVVANASAQSCQSIAYTYSEPIAYYEYMYDTAKVARAKGIKNLWITNGSINEKPLRDLTKYIDAANVNLKSFDEKVYQSLNGGSLQPVLNTLKVLKEEGVWFEMTNLIVPTWTDDLPKISEMSQWLVKNGFSGYPIHFSRFTPIYKLSQLPFTPVDVLERARKVASDAGMKYVYIGNVPGHPSESTYCPRCGKVIIERNGFKVLKNGIKDSSCGFCGEHIEGVWAA
jgi:pyruvate formate lyase activating enzyme